MPACTYPSLTETMCTGCGFSATAASNNVQYPVHCIRGGGEYGHTGDLGMDIRYAPINQTQEEDHTIAYAY